MCFINSKQEINFFNYMGIYDLTKEITEKHKYIIIDGKLCVQHYLLLQQLTYHKKLKDNSYKEYKSYHIKFPKAVKELLKYDTVFLENREGKLVVHTRNFEGYKKIKIQETKKGKNDVGYQLTIPQKLMNISNYKRKKTCVLCQVIAADNSEGFIITLELFNE